MASEQTAMHVVHTTLPQAGSRSGPDFTPACEGEEIAVAGKVAARPFACGAAYWLPIQDDVGFGLIREGPLQLSPTISPGDWLEAPGAMASCAGLPVLVPGKIQKLSIGPPPTPKYVDIKALSSFRNRGTLAPLEGDVVSGAQTTRHQTIRVPDDTASLEVLVPGARKPQRGDRVRFNGLVPNIVPTLRSIGTSASS